MSRTSSKGNFKPKRVSLVCPACGKRFSLMPSVLKKIDSGKRGPCCSGKCGQAYRKIREHARGLAEVPVC